MLIGETIVYSDTGKDVTCKLVVGAERTLKFCQETGIKVAILNAHNLSCGSLKTKEGAFTEPIIPGNGIAAELLEQNGITVYNEENL